MIVGRHFAGRNQRRPAAFCVFIRDGEYDFDAFVGGAAISDLYYSGPGRIDMEVSLAVEAVGVPEPSGGALVCAAAVVATIGWGRGRFGSMRKSGALDRVADVKSQPTVSVRHRGA
jgi:hypothetical protein